MRIVSNFILKDIKNMSSFTRFNAGLSLRFLGRSCDGRNDVWKLNEGFEFYLEKDKNSFIRVPEGFITDGASVPRLFWLLLPPWGEYGQAAVLHDYLLEGGLVHNETEKVSFIVKRDVARKYFYDAMKVVKVRRWRRYLMIGGVWLLDQWRKVFPTRELGCSNYEKYQD